MPNIIIGTPAGDLLNGTDGDDLILGDAGDDTIFGGIGDDVILGGTGDNDIYDGAGSDICQSEGGSTFMVADVTDPSGDDTYALTGPGEMVVFYTAASRSIFVDLTAGVARGAEIGNDSLVNIAVVYGGEGADGLRGNDEANHLTGMGGNDRILGLGGDDDLRGWAGDDAMAGGDGDDFLLSGAGNDTITGGNGDDGILGWEASSVRVSAGDGNDDIWGSDGNDTIYAGAGDDDILALHRHDFLSGGTGADIFHLDITDTAAGMDWVSDFEDGIDLLSFGGSIDLSQYSIETPLGILLRENPQGNGVFLRGMTMAQLDDSDFY